MTAILLLCAIALTEIPECLTLTNDTSNDFVVFKSGCATPSAMIANQTHRQHLRLWLKVHKELQEFRYSILIIGIGVFPADVCISKPPLRT
jgi:hypothetical protein